MPSLMIDGGSVNFNNPIPVSVAKAIAVIDSLPPVHALTREGLAQRLGIRRSTVSAHVGHPELMRRIHRIGKTPYFAPPLTVAWFEAHGMRAPTDTEWAAHVESYAE